MPDDQTHRDGGKPRERPAPRTNPDTVAQMLQRAFEDTASEPLPDALADLLKRLG